MEPELEKVGGDKKNFNMKNLARSILMFKHTPLRHRPQPPCRNRELRRRSAKRSAEEEESPGIIN